MHYGRHTIFAVECAALQLCSIQMSTTNRIENKKADIYFGLR